jgi:polysaccharide export outer membrane protein
MIFSKRYNMRKIQFGIFSILALISVSSCISNEKIIYLQNLEGKTPIPEGELITYEIPEYRLQFNDIISVNIATAEDMIENGFNNTDAGAGAGNAGQQGIGGGGDLYYLTGYTVNKNGDVRLPIVGDVSVRDKTLEEARLEIEEKVRFFVKSDLFVTVKLGGIRFSALGEFRAPGKFTILQDRVTILEAIAQAGDLTTIAKREDLLLIRQYPDGTRLHRINLNDRNLIGSPFYFIQPNDQLYVEPMKVREIGAGENFVQTFSLVLSTLTFSLLVISLF